MTERNWREANGPAWAKEAAQAEIDAFRLTAALAWPTEAKPAPLPFRWGDYDRLVGTPVPGTYWSSGRYVTRVEIAKNDGTVSNWKEWVFKQDGRDWSSGVVRGPLFATERDAQLWALWLACEESAERLMRLREKIA